MEEVDEIIIDSLRHLGCDIGDNIQILKQFDADLVVSALSSCLETITPNTAFPKKLPPSMSAKLKVASNLAQHIKDLGFRGDMGYQTILYCNEIDIRRVLMFLIERLPRDTNKTTPVEQTGYVPKTVRAIEENIRKSLEQIWVPSCFISRGVRESEGGYTFHSTGDSCPLFSERLEIPNAEVASEVFKQYWVHTVPDVTRQCSKRKIIPSLLFKDIEFPQNSHMLELMKKYSQTTPMALVDDGSTITADSSGENLENVDLETTTNDDNNEVLGENRLIKLLNDFKEVKSAYVTFQEAVKKDKLLIAQVVATKNKEEDILKESLAKLKLKTKTLAIVNNEENMTKLKNLIQTAKDRQVELSNQWNEIQAPLLDEYTSLQNTLITKEARFQEDQTKLNSAKETYAKLVKVMNEKSVLEENLTQKCKQLNRTNNRSAYTRRILEIIGNIKKQNVEIQNILKDTREIQKDINNLTGQVDRSFTLADELIFFDAKTDETARKAYKLLAALRDECSTILKAVTDLGLTERESRNLEEQIESEKSKEISLKLERVYSDLIQIQRETETLMKNSQG